MKVVINKCYGGFSLSPEAIQRYADLKGVHANSFHDRDIPRNDTALVRVVEELGKQADGRHASLKVVEIPDGTEWIIDEYDGIERVHERHESWG